MNDQLVSLFKSNYPMDHSSDFKTWRNSCWKKGFGFEKFVPENADTDFLGITMRLEDQRRTPSIAPMAQEDFMKSVSNGVSQNIFAKNNQLQVKSIRKRKRDNQDDSDSEESS